MKRKGIILAGGTGSRLHPSTIAVSKQLMPVYDKPMIYYPLSVLIQAGIRDIMIITTPNDKAVFEKLLSDGSQWGLNLTYATQPRPEGIAQALIISEDFLDGGPSALILGDNLFFGSNFIKSVTPIETENSGATVFGYQVEDPSAYGVVGFDSEKNVVSIIEKPTVPASNYAVTGLYFYDERAPEFAKQISPSARGEFEITALNEIYLKNGDLKVVLLDSDTTWLDTGTHRSLFEAAEFVKILVSRQGVRICCPEVESFRQGWITADRLLELAKPLAKSGYGNYLKRIALGH
jgi:glucose-1-phosphate thymidylyltransferase